MAEPVTESRAALELPPPLTYAQLHEQACVVCGSDDYPLFRAGHRQAAGLNWAVAACPAHAEVTR